MTSVAKASNVRLVVCKGVGNDVEESGFAQIRGWRKVHVCVHFAFGGCKSGRQCIIQRVS